MGNRQPGAGRDLPGDKKDDKVKRKVIKWVNIFKLIILQYGFFIRIRTRKRNSSRQCRRE